MNNLTVSESSPYYVYMSGFLVKKYFQALKYIQNNYIGNLSDIFFHRQRAI